MNNYLKTFLSGSAVSLAGAILLGITNYLIRRTLCNTMSLADYGIFYSTFSLLSIIFCFTDLGLTQSGTVMIASSGENHAGRDRIFTHLFCLKTGVALLCSAGVSAFYLLSKSTADMVFILLYLAYFSVQILNGTLQTLWGGQKKYSVQQASYLFIAILTLAALYLIPEVSLRAAAGCFLFAVVSSCIAGLLFSRLRGLGTFCFKADKMIFKQLFSTGCWIAVTSTLFTGMSYMDTVMLRTLHGAESAGLYNVALPIMQIIQGLMVFPAVFLPIAVDMEKRHEYARLRLFVRYALLIALTAILPIGVFFYYCSPWLIHLLFKPEYTSAAAATTILCVSIIFFTLGNFLFQIMLSLKKTAVMAAISIISVIANIFLNYFLISRYGLNGAASANLISYIIFALLTYAVLEYNIRKLKNHSPSEKSDPVRNTSA